jgi:hypothetical protein
MLTVFENRVLPRIFSPKRDEVTGGWRKLHNEKLHNLYSSPDIIRVITSRSVRWAGQGELRNAYKILVGLANSVIMNAPPLTTDYEAQYYSFFSILLLLSLSWVQIFSSALCPPTLSVCVFPLEREIECHIHVKQDVLL